MTLDPRAAHFAAARQAAGGELDAAMIAPIDAALDIAGVERAKASAPLPMPKPTGNAFDRGIIAHLEFEEGRRSKAYKDHLGYWTIGIGRLIDPRKGGRITAAEDAILMGNNPSRRGKKWREYVLTTAEADMLLLNDVERFADAMADWPAWKKVQGNSARMVAMLSMCFQMGEAGLKGFHNSLKLVERGRYAAAADNFMKSLWAKQTPARARRVTDLIRTGRFP